MFLTNSTATSLLFLSCILINEKKKTYCRLLLRNTKIKNKMIQNYILLESKLKEIIHVT